MELRRILALLCATCLAVGILCFISDPVDAQSCRPGDIEVGRDAYRIYCKPRAEYAECIRQAGEKLKRATGVCIGDCFTKHDVGIYFGEAICMGTCVTSGGGPACLATCLGGAVGTKWVLARQCEVEATPCLDGALENDRKAKEACKR